MLESETWYLRIQFAAELRLVHREVIVNVGNASHYNTCGYIR